MEQRFGEVVERLRQAVLGGPGETPQSHRQEAFARGGAISAAPGALEAYLTKVSRHAYKVTDEDVASLRAEGLSENAIYELTIATAVGEGLRRLDRGLAAVRGEEHAPESAGTRP